MEKEIQVFSPSMMDRIINLVRNFEGVDIQALLAMVGKEDQSNRIQIMVTGALSGGYYPGVVVIKPSPVDDYQKIGDDNTVRVKSNGGALEEDEVYDCHFIGTTDDYYMLYETLLVSAAPVSNPLESEGWVYTGGTSFPGINTQYELEWLRKSDASVSNDIIVPSNGYWYVTAQVAALIQATPSGANNNQPMTLYFYPSTSGADGVTVEQPYYNGIGGIAVHEPFADFPSYVCRGMGTLSFIIRADDSIAGTRKMVFKVELIVTAPTPSPTYNAIVMSSVPGVAYPITSIVMHKLANL